MLNVLDSYSIQEVEHFELLAKQVVEGFIIGLHKSPFHGFSAEFAEHRIYNQGDDVKNIDWKVYARTDKLYIKNFEEETNLRCRLVIDASSSMYYPDANAKLNKIKFATFAAACLTHLLYKQRDAFGLSVFNNGLDLHTHARSSFQQYQRVMNELYKLQIAPKAELKTDIIKALHNISETIHRRSIVCIFSDMFDDNSQIEKLFSALQHLRYNKHEVILFHTLANNTEIDFNFDNQLYEMKDMESNISIRLNPIDFKEKYEQLANENRKKMKDMCGQYNIDYVETDVEKGYTQVLYPYFLKRIKMK